MKKSFRLHNLFLTAILCLSVFSCKIELVPSPTQGTGKNKNPADYSGVIQPPLNLTATNGLVRTIELSWDSVEGAVQYQIFSAADSFHNFEEIGVTKGTETSFTVEDQPFGITRAYTVRAVSYFNKASFESNIAIGSTLSVPFIIEIEPEDDGSTMNINWWLENCTPQTYQDKVQYLVTVFDEKHLPVPGIEPVITTETNAGICGLSPNTAYYFQVSASTDNFETCETSDFTNRETAHKVIPQKVKELLIDQGISKDNVFLNWLLPDLVFTFDSTSGSYELHPVYFTIQRKTSDADDSEYTGIVGYIGTDTIPQNLNSEIEAYRFDCETNTVYDRNGTVTDILTIEKSTDSNAVTGYNEYGKYTSLSKITYIDSTAKRGIQYTYKIQTYTDFVSKIITSETESAALENGWLLPSAEFKAIDTINKNENDENVISSINVSFDLKFNTYGKKYYYLITQTKAPLTDITALEQEIPIFTSATETGKTFDNPGEQTGYYFYKLYITDTATSLSQIPAQYLDVIQSPGVVTVTDDASLIPEINNFQVRDCFKDHFELSWDKISDECIYQLEWEDFTSEGTPIGTKNNSGNFTQTSFTSAQAGQISTSGNSVILKHYAPSGIRRKYTLKATNGLSVTKSDDTEYMTLGTPAPAINTYDYKTITVEWPKVQKADNYIVSAYYEHDPSQSQIFSMSDNSEPVEENGTVTFTIDEPAGYNDPDLSGKPIKLTVKAINNTTNDSTQTDITVKNLGPAEIGTQSYGNATSDRLRITWNKIDGATGYIIYRTKYIHETSDEAWDFKKADTYFYNAETEKITQNGESDEKRVKVDNPKNGTYLLTDISVPLSDSTSSYQENQAEIALGYTYGYVVIPVNNKADDFVFDTDQNYLKVTSDSKVAYTKPFTDTKCGTYGYGLNVKAAKAENQNTVEVTWQKPFATAGTVPYIYRRQKGSNVWTCIGSTGSDKTVFNDPLTNQNKTKAYYYAVEYAKAEAPLNYLNVYKEQQDLKDDRYSDSRHESGTKIEEFNKGYLFYTEINTIYNGTIGTDGKYIKNDGYYYSQAFKHSIWNFEERAYGPEGYTVYALNYNTTLAPVKLADITINSDGSEDFALSLSNGKLNDGSNDTLLMLKGSDLIVAPAGITNGTATTTNGITKVLRSTKTFYNFETEREYTKNGESKTVDLNLQTYGYRQITDDELAKCIGLIIADGIYKAGIPAADGLVMTAEVTTKECSGGTGTLKLMHTAWRKYLQWGFIGDYTPYFEQGCSSKYREPYSSEFTLTSGLCNAGIVGSDGNKLYHLAPLNITILHESGLESMNGVITFSAGAAGKETKIGSTWLSSSTTMEWNLSIIKDNTQIVSISKNQSNVLSYFPYELDSKHETGDNSLNTGFETYKNSWWN